MFDFDFGEAVSSAGTYYNSVTDSFNQVPVGAPAYGNGDANSDVAGVWASIGGAYDTVATSVSGAASSVASGVSSIASGAFSSVTGAVDSFVGWTEKNLFILIGGVLLAVWVLAKSGIIPQLAQVIPMWL